MKKRIYTIVDRQGLIHQQYDSKEEARAYIARQKCYWRKNLVILTSEYDDVDPTTHRFTEAEICAANTAAIRKHRAAVIRRLRILRNHCPTPSQRSTVNAQINRARHVPDHAILKWAK